MSDCKTLSFLELPLTKVIYIIKIYFRQMLFIAFFNIFGGYSPYFCCCWPAERSPIWNAVKKHLLRSLNVNGNHT